MQTTLIDKADEVSDFEDNWGKKTESKSPAKPVPVDPPGKKEEPDPEPETKPASTVDPKTETATKSVIDIGADLSAELTTAGIDSLQSIIFNIINNAKIKRRIGKESAGRLGDVLDQIAAGTKKEELQLSSDDEKLLWKLKRLRQVKDDIPFSDAEYDKMNKLFSKYYEATGQRMPPWLGLIIAIGEAIGMRLADAIGE